MKETMEFWCSTGGGGCGKYWTSRLRVNINGNFTMVCPNCGHEHNRVIKGGVITSDRCNSSNGKADKIISLKSAVTEKSVLDNRPDKEECSMAVPRSEPSKVVNRSGLPGLWDRFRGRKQ